MRLAIIGVLALLALQGTALAQSRKFESAASLADEAAIVALLDTGRSGDAAQKIDQLVESRLPNRVTEQGDPVLDRLLGEILAEASPRAASIMLGRALRHPSTRDVVRYDLLLARANELVGEPAAAEGVYRAILARDSITPQQRKQATIALAQLLLADKPGEVGQLLQAYLDRSPEAKLRWEAELLAARTERLLGRQAEARALLDKASMSAWAAPLADLALARIALDRALVAGMAGDREALISMTGAASNGSGYTTPDAIMSPLCGSGGVTADDFVVLEIITDTGKRPRVNILHASRLSVAAAFLGINRGGGAWRMTRQAKSVLLRCTIRPTAKNWTPGSPDLALTEWLVGRGIYPVMGSDRDGKAAEMAERLLKREARFGKGSPILIPVLVQTLGRGSTVPADAAGRERLLSDIERLSELLTREKAPGSFRFPVAMLITGLKVAVGRMTPGEAIQQVQPLMQELARDKDLPLDMLLALAGSTSKLGFTSSDFQEAFLTESLTTLEGRMPALDPRLGGLALELVRLKRQLGDQSGARAVLAKYGLSENLCVAFEPPLRFRSSDIRPEDYPSDALVGAMPGLTVLEFSVDNMGSAKETRIIAEDPPFIFAQAALERAPTIRYEPPRRNGLPVTCQGAVQKVRWQVPWRGSSYFNNVDD